MNNAKKAEANLAKLPERGYAIHPVTRKIVLIERGESGYRAILSGLENLLVAELNAKIGVSKGQAEAMLTGSMFGWHVPGANPEKYDEDGKWK